ADALTAGAAEGQRRIDLVLDVDECVEHHRTAIVHIDIVNVGTRVLIIVGRPAVDLEGAHVGCALRLRPYLAFSDLGVLREGELNHCTRLLVPDNWPILMDKVQSHVFPRSSAEESWQCPP